MSMRGGARKGLAIAGLIGEDGQGEKERIQCTAHSAPCAVADQSGARNFFTCSLLGRNLAPSRYT